LRIKDENGVYHRTPAMASGLTHRIWSTREWLLSPILGGEGRIITGDDQEFQKR
jgi:hypothetical protein